MSEKLTPEVLWAQRSSSSDAEKNFIWLTISVPDVSKSDFKLDLKPTTLTFSGVSSSLKRDYHLELEFFGEIDPEQSKINHTSKNIELQLQKKELKEEYWPRLLKESKKQHFLKTNFDKWVDEDEQEEAAEEDMSQFGGMGGMPGMGAGGGGDFGGIDFSKLGGAGGMPDMSALQAMAGGAGGDMDEEGEEDDDEEDMPALQEEPKK